METQLLNLPGFAQKGINTDLPSYTLPGDFLTEAKNIRILANSIRPFGGFLILDSLPVDFNPGHLTSHEGPIGQFWVIPGDDSVLAYDGSIYHDISNISGGGYAGVNDPDDWHSCAIAQVLVLNHPGHFPEYWPDPNGAIPLQYLPWDFSNTWADVNQSCRIMRSHKQFLFAMDLVDNGIEYPDGVRWSTPADIGLVPESWDPLDITKTAGLINLGGEGGRIIDGLSMRDAFVVYREGAISVFDYVGGQFVWRIRHSTATQGLVSKNAIVEIRGKHIFISNGDIMQYDGNTFTSLLHNRLRRRFVGNYDVSKRDNGYVVHNKLASELWFCITEIGFSLPNVAYLYNYEDDSWAIRDIYDVSPFAAYGPQLIAPVTWDSTAGIWDDIAGNWNIGQTTTLSFSITAVSKPSGPGQSGKLALLDHNSTDEISQYSTVIERIGFALAGLDNVTTITRIYPHLSGTGTVFIEVGSQDHINAPVTWKPGVWFEAGVDRKVDIRTTGELHCFRFSVGDSPKRWELSGMDIEFVMAGKR